MEEPEGPGPRRTYRDENLHSSGTPSVMREDQSVTVIASELAEFVYCAHAWHLKRQGAPLSAEAERHLQEGIAWQDQKDANIQLALRAQQQAQRISHHARIALWLLLFMAGMALLYGLPLLLHSRS